MVDVGQRVEPETELAAHRAPDEPRSVAIAAPLRVAPELAREALVAAPGTEVHHGEVLARHGTREVLAPAAGLLLAYDEAEGSMTLAPLGAARPIVSHVMGEVVGVDEGGIDIRVDAEVVDGVGGLGAAVHGELTVAVHEPGDELRAGAIDVGASGRIVVGGSRASAETMTRARAMGVAGLVLGGVLDKELRDFEALQRRRREVAGISDAFGLLLIEGYGKVGLDPQLFAWFRRHAGHMASLFGTRGRLYIYDADPPPVRSAPASVGDTVVAHRRPFAGRGGRVVRIIAGAYATPSGIPTRMAVVRFADGRTAAVPLANLEVSGPASNG
jgi:hypothetical protein